ncbi:restriction endonuclease subunit S [Enterococcus faecalis]|uniref:restriction endonuclease subunit S n=2 Tax=Enterococcus faecalis TaxID=1351 RepID=UPI0006ACA8C4|nr:restriction endonuclease subunit S [Enterococcus faecalis]EHP0970687.1 restriction endonuclease subunit S [Enterococcus faecalis]EJR1648064.1 restriction endonuclease subunit S [Enterococcus faecalis]MBD9873356.1 restriction endonuclease subunit S [Enterococcus faecalis]MBE9445421.1 restriction endonuclease subunit S [Enterococcus faecalis]MBE9450843.1 restriction endonuclease subunit S [Enterococcus faecalis]
MENLFNYNWELCKLKEITERVKGNDGRMDLPTLTISASQGWLNQKDRFSGNIAGKEQKNYTLLLKNELSYNHGNSKLAKYGAVFSLKTYEEALVPRVYHSFKSTKNSDPDFLEYIFATKKPDKELGKLVSSGARMDGLLNINYDDFSNIKINIPHVHEQKKISNLLRKIDDTIALHQRKLDQLKELKKAYLQLMFPKKDETVPQVRFANFEENWELCKLENIIEKQIKGKAKVENLCNGSVEYLDANRLNGGKPIYTKALPDVSERDIIILWDGSKAGKVYYGFKGVLGSTLKAYQLKECANSQFIYQQLLDNQNNIYNNYRTPNIPHVVKNFSSIFPIWMTSFEEQSQMADILSNLDNRIILQQNLTDTMISLKKSYLQNMFI